MQQIRLLLVAVATLQENQHWLQLFQKLNWRTSFGASLFFHEMYQCTCRALYLLGLFFAQIDFSDLPGTVRQIIFMAPIELSSSMIQIYQTKCHGHVNASQLLARGDAENDKHLALALQTLENANEGSVFPYLQTAQRSNSQRDHAWRKCLWHS